MNFTGLISANGTVAASLIYIIEIHIHNTITEIHITIL